MRVGALCGLVGAAGLALSGSGCATSEQLELEISRLRREVRSLRSNLEETSTSVDRLEGRVTLLMARKGARKPSAPAAAESASTPAAAPAPIPPLPVIRLQGDGPAIVETVGDEGALDDGGPPIVLQLGAGDAKAPDKLTVDRGVLRKPDPVLGRKSDKAPAGAVESEAKAAYQAALRKLRDEGQPGAARPLFAAFKRRFATTEWTDNATYWLAECSFAEAKYKQAIDEFLKVLEEHPKSPKVPDALLKVAQSWKRLGDEAKAVEVFRRIAERYSGSEAASVAREALDSGSNRDER